MSDEPLRVGDTVWLEGWVEVDAVGSMYIRYGANVRRDPPDAEVERLRRKLADEQARTREMETRLIRLAEVDGQIIDLERDLSDARNGWEQATARVRELEAELTASKEGK